VTETVSDPVDPSNEKVADTTLVEVLLDITVKVPESVTYGSVPIT
jgi:hypothetical protein